MKKIFALMLVFVFASSFCACASKHYDETNISELYDSEWIVGKTRSEVRERYGEFNREYISSDGENVGAYYVNYENRGIDPSYIHDTYFVIFNTEYVAVEAYFKKTSNGG